MFVAGSIKDSILRFLGKHRRGYSIVFDSLCLMLWTIGISDFEMLWRMVNGCEGAWLSRICWICCDRLCQMVLVEEVFP